MRLPPGDLSRFVEKRDPSPGCGDIAIAYRHGALFLYATSRKHCARLRVDTAEGELEQLAGELSAAKFDPEQDSILISVDVYKALRKNGGPFVVKVSGGGIRIETLDGVSYGVRSEPGSRMVELIEALIRCEQERRVLVGLHMDANLMLDCQDVLKRDRKATDVAAMSVPISDDGAILMRDGMNVSVFMPMNGRKQDAIENIRSACLKSLDSGNASSGLATAILDILEGGR